MVDPVVYSRFMCDVRETMKAHPSLRLGQTVFNTMLEFYPEKAEQYRGSDLDPFYRDERVKDFLRACLDGK